MLLIRLLRSILPILMLLASLQAQSQHLNFRNYQAEDGLASSLVSDVIQDKQGYIWIATEKGVSRFNGSVFKNFTTRDGLEDNAIHSLYEDKAGRIWFTPLTTGTPLSYYKDGFIHNSENTKVLASFSSASLITSVVDDKNGDLWVATIKNGLYRFHDDSIQTFNTENGLPTNSVFYLWTNGEGNVVALLGTNELALFDGEGFTYRDIEEDFITGYSRTSKGGIIYPSYEHLIWLNDTAEIVVENKAYDELLKKGILGLKEDKNGDLWFWTIDQGVFRVSGESENQTVTQFLNGKKVTAILIDHEGNIWFTTVGEGVFLLPMGAEEIVSYNTQERLKDIRITALEGGIDGTVWLGTVSGSLHYIKEDGRLRSYTNKGSSVPGGKIRAILPLSEREVIAGTNINWAWMQDGRVKRSLGVGRVKAISKQNGLIFLGTSQGLYALDMDELSSISLKGFKEKKVILEGEINALEVVENRLLVGSDRGLSIINSNGEVEQLMNDEPVVSIAAYESIVWIATEGKGLLKFDGKELSTYPLDESISSSLSTGIGVNEKGVWLSTNTGLNHIQFTEDDSAMVKLYTSAEGMASDEVNSLLVNDNAIWAGTNLGLTKFGLKQAGKNVIAPFIYITSHRIGGQYTTLSTSLELEYGHQALEIGFEGIGFRNSRNLTYRYRMLGYEDAWTYTTFNNVPYRALPSGKYVFQVTAVNEDGVWNDDFAFIEIEVQKPYWETAWFFGLVLISVLILLLLIYRYITYRIRTRERIKSDINQQIAESEMKALRAQMNPHFIFNALNSIQKFLITNDKMMATAYLSKFASLIRKVLDNSRESEVTLFDEIKALELYLELEEMRFGDKLKSEIDIDEDVDMGDTLIPSMLIQPYVENAIKHGIMHRLDGGTVRITIRVENEVLICSIEDDGIGREASAEMQKRSKEHRSLGMEVSEERVNILNTKRSNKLGLIIEDLKSPAGEALGTKVQINIPLHTTR